MTVSEEKVKEHTAIQLLKRYGKLLLVKGHREKKEKLLKKIKEMAKELAEKGIVT